MKKTLLLACSMAAFALSAQAEVKIGGNNKQSVDVKNGAVVNMAAGAMTKAEQNLASNDGTK